MFNQVINPIELILFHPFPIKCYFRGSEELGDNEGISVRIHCLRALPSPPPLMIIYIFKTLCLYDIISEGATPAEEWPLYPTICTFNLYIDIIV